MPELKVYDSSTPKAAVEQLAQRINELARANLYVPPQGDGLVFPPGVETVERALERPGAGFVITQEEGSTHKLLAYLLTHIGDAIGKYAHNTGCVTRQLEIAPDGIPAVVRSICIDRAQYGRHIGTPMLLRALELLPPLGVQLLGANLRSYPANDRLVGVRYQNAGFAPTGLYLVPDETVKSWSNEVTEHWGVELYPTWCPITYQHLVCPTVGYKLEGTLRTLKVVPA